jgi:hypothetical protein
MRAGRVRGARVGERNPCVVVLMKSTMRVQ